MFLNKFIEYFEQHNVQLIKFKIILNPTFEYFIKASMSQEIF